MYTGTADHALTAELVTLVDVPVIASGDVNSRARAEALLHTTGCDAVMVGRAAQGNPWLLGELAGRDEQATRRRTRSRPSWCASSARPCASSASTAASRSCASSTAGTCAAARSRARCGRTWPQARTVDEVEELLYAAAPGARALVEAMEAELAALGDGSDDVELGLPISIYGGG